MKKRTWLMIKCVVGIVLIAVIAYLLLLSRTDQPSTTPVAAVRVVTQGDPIDGIRCESMEGSVLHYHVHVTLLVDGELKSIPEGIGIENQAESCYYWVHTHDSSGIVHIESSIKRSFHLGDFFNIWKLPLTSTQVATYQDRKNAIRVFLNGQPYYGNPRQLELKPHQEITLEVGPHFVTPPNDYHFPPDLQ